MIAEGGVPMDLSMIKGYRTYILMGANIVCVGLESMGVIPQGTWLKITAVLVSLGIVTNRAGSKNDAAAVAQALAAVNQVSLPGSSAQDKQEPPETPSPAAETPPDPIGDFMATVEGIVAAYKDSQGKLEQLGRVIRGVDEVINWGKAPDRIVPTEEKKSDSSSPEIKC